MHCAYAILSYVTYPALQYFSTLSHKRYDFRAERWTYMTKLVVAYGNFANASKKKGTETSDFIKRWTAGT
jgi:hypothetical protein